MTTQAKHVLDEALTLSIADRRRLAEALLDSIPPESEDEIQAAWLAEAQQRAGRLERGEETARDGEQVVAEILASLRGAGSR